MGAVADTIEAIFSPITGIVTSIMENTMPVVEEVGRGMDTVLTEGGRVTSQIGNVIDSAMEPVMTAIPVIMGSYIGGPVGAGIAGGLMQYGKTQGDIGAGIEGALASALSSYAAQGVSNITQSSISPSYSSQFGNTNFQIGGNTPMFATEGFSVDPSLAYEAVGTSPYTFGSGAVPITVNPSLVPTRPTVITSPAPQLSYLFGEGLQPITMDPELQAYGEALGPPTDTITPFTFGEGALPFQVNPGLSYENATYPYTLLPKEPAFRVDSSLDPSASPIDIGLSVPGNWTQYANIISQMLSGTETGDASGFQTFESVKPGSMSPYDNMTTFMSGSGLGAGKSKGLGAGEALDTTVPLFYMPESEQKQGYGKGLYYS